MEKIRKVDVLLISLGLATLVAQRFFLSSDDSLENQSRQGKSSTAGLNAATRPAVKREPEWELTFPPDALIQDLTPPVGVEPNPFLEVRSIIKANGPVQDYAGKDTDMRQLLLAHAGRDYLFILQQQAANEMLRQELFHHFYSDPKHPHMLESIGFYTDQLNQARSEDAKLIYMCLKALKDYWPEERLAAVASATAKRVQARAQREANDTTTVNGYHRQVYARELKKMASRLSKNA